MLQDDLVCGEGGSNGSTVLGRVNLNHHTIGDMNLLTTAEKTSVVGAINEVDAKTAQIAINTADIISNANAITNLDDALVLLNGRVVALEDLNLFAPIYEFTKATAILDIDEQPDWTPLASVTTTDAGIGDVFELKFSVSGTLEDTNDSAILRYRIDGGAWTEYRQEAKDTTDTFGYAYLFPYVATGTTLTLEVEASKDIGANTLDINYADAIIEKKR